MFYKETKDQTISQTPSHENLEELTVCSTRDIPCQALFDRFFFAFPNLRRLNIYNHSGQWNVNRHEFLLDLRQYNLISLSLDITPVKKRMARLEEHFARIGSFFVLDVSVLADNRYSLLKLSYDFSECSEVREYELKNYIPGTDYVYVRIVVNSLERLELKMDKGAFDSENYLDKDSRSAGSSVKILSTCIFQK